MKRNLFSTAVILALSFELSAFGADLAGLQDSFANVASSAKPAVVHITTVHEEVVRLPQFFFGDPEDFFQEFFEGKPKQAPNVQRFRTQGSGSGFIFDANGFLLTNEHVVRGADDIHVILTLPNGKEKTYAARVIGKDPYLDLAVVKMTAGAPFPFVALGDSDKVRVGDWALAIGSPFALGQTVTAGIISAVKQTLVIEGRRYNDLLQTDAAINRGNSGGPLLDLNGKVIGINSAIYSPSGAFAGIGFAIPINAAKEILSALQAGKASQHGWLGIEVAQIDEIIQRRFGLPSGEGAMVNRVLRRSPAEKGGLRRGDVIKSVDKEPVSTPDDLIRLTGRAKPGARVILGLIREGRPREVEVRIGERPDAVEMPAEPQAAPEKAAPSGWSWEGVEFAEEDGKPVVVAVAADSKVYGYLLPKDVIAGVDSRDVGGLADLKQVLAKADLAGGVVFDILRGGQPMYISIQTGK